MARCVGPTCPYGWGHPEEHRQAAIKGWRTRREGRRLQHSARGVEHLFGTFVSEVHQHKRGLVHFWHDGQFFELPRKEFDALGREGHKLYSKDTRQWTRNILKKAEKAKKAEEEAIKSGENPNQLEAVRRAERANVLRRLRGRIKPYRNPTPKTNKQKDKYLELEDYRELPASVRNIRRGTITLDEAAEEIERDFPWLKVRSENDLISYLRNARAHSLRKSA